MFHFIKKVLETLQPYIPLMQTIVWPIFVIIIVLIFRKPLGLFIEVLRKRIEDGSPIEAMGVKLGSKASQAEVDEKVNQEATQLQVADQAMLPTGQPTSTPANAMEKAERNVYASIRLSEELVMSKLLAERNLKIERQVRTGKPGSFIFDGIAFVGQKIIAIEVKYLSRNKILDFIANQSMNQINIAYMSLDEDSRKNFSLILAIVVDREFTGSTGDIINKLSILKDKYMFPVEIIAYRIEDLKKELKVD